jgi:20S proteasome alpha/beta subunit
MACLIILSLQANAHGSSPIRNLEPSWAASSAQGTTIAVSYPIGSKDNEVGGVGVVLLMRSPVPARSIEALSSEEEASSSWVELDGLRVVQHAVDTLTTADASRRWTPLGSALCCMTGLASDVDYLSRALQKQVDLHRTIYGGSHPLTTLKIVRKLATLLQEAAQYQGGRPYGVQALIVGQDRSSLNIFTLDPSGGFRHWDCATAIGRSAQQAKKHLHESLSSNKVPQDGSKALEEAIRASIKAMREASLDPAADRYEALLVRTIKTNRELCVATIDPDQVNKCRERLQKEIDSPGSTSVS